MFWTKEKYQFIHLCLELYETHFLTRSEIQNNQTYPSLGQQIFFVFTFVFVHFLIENIAQSSIFRVNRKLLLMLSLFCMYGVNNAKIRKNEIFSSSFAFYEKLFLKKRNRNYKQWNSLRFLLLMNQCYLSH